MLFSRIYAVGVDFDGIRIVFGLIYVEKGLSNDIGLPGLSLFLVRIAPYVLRDFKLAKKCEKTGSKKRRKYCSEGVNTCG